MKLQLTNNITLFTNADNTSIQRVYLTYATDPRTVSDEEIQKAQKAAERQLRVKFRGFVRPSCDSRHPSPKGPLPAPES